MGLIGDLAGAFGISKTGILAGALKMVGVPDKAAHAIGLAAELARGFTKDGFDFDKVNKGALARHALRAFGVNSPIATLGLTAALKILPKGFLGAGLGSLGALGVGGAGIAAALGGAGLVGSCMAGLSKSQLGIGSMLTGMLSPGALAGTAFGLVGGDKSGELRNTLGMQRFAGGPGGAYAALPKPAFFEDIIAALMCDFIKDKQEEIEGKLQDLQKRSEDGKSAGNQAAGAAGSVARKFVPGAGAVNDAATKGNQDSRNIEFEMIKNEIQKLSQMQQAMSNVLNTMNEQAMNAIRHIKG